MKSLERRFNNITEKNPNWSSYVCFSESIRGQDFGKKAVRYWFHKLINKNEYKAEDKKEILMSLDGLTKRLRTARIGGKAAI